MIEKFIEIKEYPNYKVSNLGRVKSIDMDVWNGKVFYKQKGRILKHNKDNYGYSIVRLSNGKNKKTIKVHKLVVMAFLGHIPCGMRLVVDHIDNDKNNNKLDNLQIITQRENVSKDKKNKTSKYTGVSFVKKTNKWYSYLRVNGKGINLGYFDNEYDAHLAYQDAISNLY